jgi:DNA topoisomerase-1
VPKKRAAKGSGAVESTVACSYSKRIGDAPAPPTAETHGPVVEKKGGKKALQPA